MKKGANMYNKSIFYNTYLKTSGQETMVTPSGMVLEVILSNP
jgi:hypothetical protein